MMKYMFLTCSGLANIKLKNNGIHLLREVLQKKEKRRNKLYSEIILLNRNIIKRKFCFVLF